MKHLAFLALVLMTIATTSCNGNGTTGAGKATTDSVNNSKTLAGDSTATPSKEVVDELSKAVNEEHAISDADYAYDTASNTVKITKRVDVPDGQPEEDFAEAIIEHEVPNFITSFKKSTRPSDVTIKSKGATITVSYVNKATNEEIIQFDITPDDLK